MKFICSLITVSDIKKSRDFYENILGQKVKFDFGDNITFEGDFSIHERTHFQKLIDNKEIKTANNSFELYFEYDDIRSIEVILEANNVEFIHKIREQPWKQRVMRFYDPDKNIIEVGESLEFVSFRLYKKGYSWNEISDTISMPVDFIKSSVQKLDMNHYFGRIPACGCFCGGCPNYLRDRNPCPGADMNKERCNGCKTFHLCCKDKEITHCFECDGFPCTKFKSWTKRWEKYGQNFIENQILLKTKGQKCFLDFFNSKIYIEN